VFIFSLKKTIKIEIIFKLDICGPTYVTDFSFLGTSFLNYFAIKVQ